MYVREGGEGRPMSQECSALNNIVIQKRVKKSAYCYFVRASIDWSAHWGADDISPRTLLG